MPYEIPERLAANCRRTPGGEAWLRQLPGAVESLQRRWRLTLGQPFEHEATCSWVASVVRADGTSAVLKLGLPHMEGEHELQGLHFWNGDPTVRLLDADEELNGMLLERCVPGISLRSLPESDQDVVVAGLLRRLWRSPPVSTPFRPLSVMTEHWSNETLADVKLWSDEGLVREGLSLLHELPQTAPREVLLATDLHAGNVLRSERKPWLVIDPKPFLGDPAYDATQHLLNCRERLRADPDTTIRRFADLLGVEHERVRLWTFARAAAGPRNDWEDESLLEMARAITS